MMTKEELWNIYMISDAEAKKNPYFSRLYIFLVKRKKQAILNSPGKLAKFALISLFSEYRACNHMGINISSLEADNCYFPVKERLKAIHLVIGEELKDTEHYLALTGLNRLMQLMEFSKVLFITFAFLSLLIPLSIKFYGMIMFSKP